MLQEAAIDIGGRGSAETRDMLIKCASTSLNSKLVGAFTAAPASVVSLSSTGNPTAQPCWGVDGGVMANSSSCWAVLASCALILSVGSNGFSSCSDARLLAMSR